MILCALWSKASAHSHWSDADIIQLGKISKRGPEGSERYSHFTPEEQRTHIKLWSIFRSPLMMCGNMPENAPLVKELLTNNKVIELNQKGIESRELYRNGKSII